jgi:hypothetical protein
MTDLGYYGDPVQLPTGVSAGAIVAYEVVTANADGTVDLRSLLGRSSRSRVPGVAGWRPTVADVVLATDVNGDPQAPAIVSVQQAANQPGTPTVTALPSTGLYDGREVIFTFAQTVNPVDAKKIFWRLRYDLASNAWYPVGAQDPIYGYTGPIATFSTFGNNVWGGVDANDPTITIPLVGDYEIDWGCGQFFVSGGTANWYISAYFNTGDMTLNGTQPATDVCTVGSASSYGSGRASKKMNVPSAAAVLRHRYYHTSTAAANVTRGEAYIKAYPRKIPA